MVHFQDAALAMQGGYHITSNGSSIPKRDLEKRSLSQTFLL
jgi:hypothetical protein